MTWGSEANLKTFSKCDAGRGTQGAGIGDLCTGEWHNQDGAMHLWWKWLALPHPDLASQVPEEVDVNHSALILGCPGSPPAPHEKARVAQTLNGRLFLSK